MRIFGERGEGQEKTAAGAVLFCLSKDANKSRCPGREISRRESLYSNSLLENLSVFNILPA